MPLNRAQISNLMEEGLADVFWKEYGDWEDEYKPFFKERPSRKRQETTISMVGAGSLPSKTEGGDLTEVDPAEGYKGTKVHTTYALGIRWTEEAQEDDLYDFVEEFSAMLGRAGRITKEQNPADILNNGFDNTYTGPDGKELFATDHPLKGVGGTWQNEPTTAVDMSVQTVMDMIILAEKTVLDDGTKAMIKVTKAWVPTDLQFIADEIFNSNLRAHTMDNTKNALLSRGTRIGIMRYLTDTDAWGMQADVHGLIRWDRVALGFGRDTEYVTGDLRFKARMRESVTWKDARGTYGSPGG